VAAFLLIHGSWHGAWCWDRVAPLLCERGHEVAAVDLPAHGDDLEPHYRASLGGYARRVRTAASTLKEKPILVGHSMGRMAITQAALEAPHLFSALVYVCAFVPVAGESLFRLVRRDRQSRVLANTSFGLARVGFAERRAKGTFYEGCSDADADWAIGRLRPEPLWPLLQRVAGRNGVTLPRGYIECSRDRAISIERQREMALRASLERIVTMDSDHSPFLSASEELADHLHDMAELGD
jgi:pimeloyl-ACP methyl ester carboxylesterase